VRTAGRAALWAGKFASPYVLLVLCLVAVGLGTYGLYRQAVERNADDERRTQDAVVQTRQAAQTAEAAVRRNNLNFCTLIGRYVNGPVPVTESGRILYDDARDLAESLGCVFEAPPGGGDGGG
jgi:hypothetical protein